MGVGRLIALLTLAIEDLLARFPVPRGKMLLLLDAPSTIERPGLHEQIFDWSDEGEGDLARSLGESLARTTHASGCDWELRLSQGGHAGVLAALGAAREVLRSESHDFCIVAGVDSYMDLPTQEWLYGTQRLKHPNRSVGLMPGEGAAVLLVERAASAKRREARALAQLGPVSILEEEYWLSDDELFPHGRALAKVIRNVVQANPRRETEIRVVINDLNGQVVRAAEWGNALIQFVDEHAYLRGLRNWMPALSFGDVGSASGAFSLCMATQAFERGYAGGSEILLCNSSERGLRGAAILRGSNSRLRGREP